MLKYPTVEKLPNKTPHLPNMCPVVGSSARLSVRLSRYLLLYFCMEFNQTYYITSSHGKGVREQNYFSVRLSVRRPSVDHAISSDTTGQNLIKLGTWLPFMVRVCKSESVMLLATLKRSVGMCDGVPSIARVWKTCGDILKYFKLEIIKRFTVISWWFYNYLKLRAGLHSAVDSASDCRSRVACPNPCSAITSMQINDEIISAVIPPIPADSRRTVVSYWQTYMFKYS